MNSRILLNCLLGAGILSLASCTTTSEQAAPEPSRIWKNFVEARETGENSLLPDYSYAGYDFLESPIPEVKGPLFNVDDYGAKAGDELSDTDAVRKAIRAASDAGGGVVLFGAGIYRLATDNPAEPILRVRSGDIVFRGVGSGSDGTQLFFPRSLDPEDPEKMYSTPFMVDIRPRSIKESLITRPKGFSKRGSRELQVEDSEQLSPGDWITLSLMDPDAVPAFFGDRPTKATWKRLQTDGIKITERHQIVAVNGDVITLRAPLQVDVDSLFDWSILDYVAIEQIGIEKLRLVGNWKGDFIHHRSALDDGGWSAIRMVSVRNSWIRDVVFEDWNFGLRIDSSAAVSILRVRFEGTPGHYSVHTRSGYGILVGLSSEEVGHYHGPSVGYGSAGSVYWKYNYSANTSFDAHSTGPYATLVDACEGGWFYGRSGGPQVGLPNHMAGLTFWNFKQTGDKGQVLNFWRDRVLYDDRDFFLNPIVVGFHGQDTRFETDSLGYYESLGEPVQPESLFEAQLKLRFGEIPDFLVREKAMWRETLASE